MVRQAAAAARDGTVLLAPRPRDVRLRQPVREAVDVQIACRARCAVRRRVRPRRGRPRPDVRPGPRAVLRELRCAVAGYARAEDELQKIIRGYNELRVRDRAGEATR